MAKPLNIYSKTLQQSTEIQHFNNEMKSVCVVLSSSFLLPDSQPISYYYQMLIRSGATAINSLEKSLEALSALCGKTYKGKTYLGGNIDVKIVGRLSQRLHIDTQRCLEASNRINKCAREAESIFLSLSKIQGEISRINPDDIELKSLEAVSKVVIVSDPIGEKLKVIKAIEKARKNTSQAKKTFNELAIKLRLFSNAIAVSVSNIAACEEKVKSRLYIEQIQTTRAINETSNTSQIEYENNIRALEDKQKEYVKIYGKESPALNAEIIRLKELYESLFGFNGKIEKMKKTTPFIEGSYWGYEGTYVDSYKDEPVNGSQCFAMAHMMQIEILGKRGYDTGLRSFSDIKVGDVVNYVNEETDKYWGHWVMITEVHGDYVIVAEGNYSQSVKYGRKITINELQDIRQIDRVQ